MRLGVTRAAEDVFKAAGQATPDPIEIAAMIDTGASHSVIQTGLAHRLNLNAVSTVAIHTPSSTNVICDVYAVRYVLPNNIIHEGTAIEMPLQSQTMQALIGRDLLADAVLIYLGYANQFTLSI